MNKLRKFLLFIAANGVLIFTGCAGHRTPTGTKAQTDSAPPTLLTVMQDYNTAASQRLKNMEGEFNKTLPSGVSPIVYLDYDVIATWQLKLLLYTDPHLVPR